MYWDVIKVVPESDLSLSVSFQDGTVGKVLFEETHLTGMFSLLWDNALSYFSEALAMAPEDTILMCHRGKALVALERFEEAREQYRAVLARDPSEVGAYLGLSQLQRAQPDDPAFAVIERTVRMEPETNLRRKTNMHFVLGKLYGDIGETAPAMAHYAEGHRYRSRLHVGTTDAPLDPRWWTCLRETITADFFAERQGWGLDVTGPIFIVGMPRSGSSLIEQILASHSRVWGAGELPDIRAFVLNRLAKCDLNRWAEIPSMLMPETIDTFAQTHWSRLMALAGGRPCVTDKLPHNFVHLWLIALLFPRATVLHSVRHPLDTCLSCYFQNFDKPHAYTDDLRALGQHYRDYRALMLRWQAVLPIRIHDVVYEDLVSDPETQIPRLLGLCGLDFESACRDFYRTERQVQTASATQVRRPLYRDSIAKWRRWEAHLGPLLETLGDLV